MMNRVIPEGAECDYEGLYYKIGVHGKLFFYNGFGWVLSNRKNADHLMAVIKRSRMDDKAG